MRTNASRPAAQHPSNSARRRGGRRCDAHTGWPRRVAAAHRDGRARARRAAPAASAATARSPPPAPHLRKEGGLISFPTRPLQPPLGGSHHGDELIAPTSTAPAGVGVHEAQRVRVVAQVRAPVGGRPQGAARRSRLGRWDRPSGAVASATPRARISALLRAELESTELESAQPRAPSAEQHGGKLTRAPRASRTKASRFASKTHDDRQGRGRRERAHET